MSANERIGILVNSYRSNIGLAAGGHVHFVEVAKRWRDVDVTIFAPQDAEAEILAVLPQARFVAIPEFRTVHWRLDQLVRMFGGLKLRSELRSMDAILCTSHFLADVVTAVAARPSRTAVTLHHMIEPPWKRHGAVLTNTIAWLSQAVSLVLAKTFIRRYIFDCSYVVETSRWATGNARCFVSTNGVSGSDEPATQLSGRRDAIYFGRLDPMKRVEDAIRAWALLPSTCDGQRLHVAGQGSAAYQQKLNDLVDELGLKERVIFHGKVDNTKKWDLLRSCGVYVFPSSEEGWGISVAEAMWAGMPCVTYDLPVFRGLFYRGRRSVRLGDVEGLASNCAELLSDENIRLELAREAGELARTFSWDRAAEIERAALDFENGRA